MGQAVGLGIQPDAQLRGGKWEKVHSTLTILLGWGGGIARSTRSATEPASLTSQRRGVDLPSGRHGRSNRRHCRPIARTPTQVVRA